MESADRLSALKAFDDTKAGVKGLVDAGVTAIPSIFHHPPESLLPPSTTTRSPAAAIPIIDLASAASRADLVSQVKQAAETVGFFQVLNHGVPEAAMAAMLAGVKRFNEEPAEAKRAYYTRDFSRRVRFQSNFDLFQSPAAGWRDTLFFEMAPAPPPPEEIPPACRAAALEYAGWVRTLGRALFRLLSEALGSGGDHYRRPLEEDMEGMGVASHYYPPCPEPHLTLGTTRHSDPSFLTVLLQDAMGGLQVLLQDAAWVEVPAVAGALVVNVGDYLQLVSNGRFRSVEHRVVANGAGPRVSVACFFRPYGAAAATTVLRPIVSGDGEEARYRSTTVEELTRHYWAKGLDGTSALDHFRL
ncbi:1-aminocyclopropane-1-carboxylate oxidase homolog 1 [Brachypodium distachyon]|uniref:Fe2OG dioxygenase domain-containing protein n=1 Tax=Brachypodium distachyon TaxID=15368 RepID=I1I1A5_BRADI|nr:1-aminocyclopropane-1-carboxylate oxidase homolog 1 [Brachypodium distachyon]KQJ95259.1 hypothetical protein BRADI_3g16110v3 [Brachypodium distachyon]|eukprot:XP_003573438.1 1-aminocyclopropane-1-carboxylate oxidase homolog 1 [Brachypodium distachyon]